MESVAVYLRKRRVDARRAELINELTISF